MSRLVRQSAMASWIHCSLRKQSDAAHVGDELRSISIGLRLPALVPPDVRVLPIRLEGWQIGKHQASQRDTAVRQRKRVALGRLHFVSWFRGVRAIRIRDGNFRSVAECEGDDLGASPAARGHRDVTACRSWHVGHRRRRVRATVRTSRPPCRSSCRRRAATAVRAPPAVRRPAAAMADEQQRAGEQRIAAAAAERRQVRALSRAGACAGPSPERHLPGNGPGIHVVGGDAAVGRLDEWQPVERRHHRLTVAAEPHVAFRRIGRRAQLDEERARDRWNITASPSPD